MQSTQSHSSGDSHHTDDAPDFPIPPMPEIGHPESWYAEHLHAAERAGDTHRVHTMKVGQYVTLATDPALPWEEKLKYLQHTLRRHCKPPEFAMDDVAAFYKQLADVVRTYCGAEALRLASVEDDLYAARQAMGQTMDQIEDDAETFFGKIVSCDHCPDWFNEDDWQQLRMMRDQWI